MNERKYESTFIPCGDALEKMDEIIGVTSAVDEYETAKKDEETPEVSG